MKSNILPQCSLKAASRLGIGLIAATVALSSAQAQGHKTNTTTGLKAGTKIDTGKKNTADGAFALKKNKDGSYNTAVGSNALRKNTGSSNVAIGNEALKRNTSGEFNVGIGDGALSFNETGENNVALGLDAGVKTDGDDNILIDHQGVAGESGIIRIGTDGTHTDTYLAGKIWGNGSGLTNLDAATLTGLIFGSQIEPASVTDVQLASEAVTSEKLASDLKLTGKIGIGTGFAPTDAFLHIKGDSVTTPFRVEVSGDSKLSVATNGGVSIGKVDETPPANGLTVAGDIEMGLSGQYQATAGTEKLKIIRGSVAPDGSILSSTGSFTVTKTLAGDYTIIFDSSFSAAPSVTCSVVGAYNRHAILALQATTTRCNVVTYRNSPTSADLTLTTDTDTRFDFIAIGPRK